MTLAVPMRVVRVALFSAALLTASASTGFCAGVREGNKTAVTPEATGVNGLVPTQPTDHFVNGKYDKTGTYIPPHYQTVSKPPFHGYFFNKHELGTVDPKPN